jgi:5-(aminomethyl)-3-furanmethanol phosphate kinase
MTSTWTCGVLRSTGAPAPHEIIKLGGSLLMMPDWPTRVAELVRDRAAIRPVLIVVGGGAIVDGLRAIDAAAPQDAALVHGLAIELMGTTARLVADAIATPLVTDQAEASAAVLDVPRWLSCDGRLRGLPVGWNVTSDSIAACIAADMHADLLLVKRVPPPDSTHTERLESLVRSSWIDGGFPLAAAGLTRIAWAAPTSVPKPGVGRTAVERGDAGRR